MPSTDAELARTLVSGRLPGMIAVRGLPDGCVPVSHATRESGQVLIAAPHGSPAWRALTSVDGAPVVLSVVDVPPLPDSPYLGAVWVAGYVDRLDGAHARTAAVEFAAENPVDLLLDVGGATVLFGLSAEEVRVQRARTTVVVDAEEFAAARPDPFRADERDLLADLRDHHGSEIASLLSVPEGEARVVRLNRYGVMVRVGAEGRLVRLDFRQPANGTCCVARALRLGHGS
jgi:hypothetical protein